MGFYKRMSDKQSEIKRYNAARRKADKLSSTPTSRLIRMETISEIERYNIAQDADRLTAFNKEVEQWQDAVSKQLKATISSRSLRIARELQPKAYTDKYGLSTDLVSLFLVMVSISTKVPDAGKVVLSEVNGAI